MRDRRVGDRSCLGQRPELPRALMPEMVEPSTYLGVCVCRGVCVGVWVYGNMNNINIYTHTHIHTHTYTQCLLVVCFEHIVKYQGDLLLLLRLQIGNTQCYSAYRNAAALLQ
jgi:hypothetical protein